MAENDQNKIKIRLAEEKIRVVASDEQADTISDTIDSASRELDKPSANGNVVPIAKKFPNGLAPTDSKHANKILSELPTEEFLELLDQSSPEQIKQFLGLLTPSQVPLFQFSRNILGDLVSIPDEPRNIFSIIAWWESRRILFNVVVGACGLPTLLVALIFGMRPDFLLLGTVEYALLANICYTAGWTSEVIARSWWKDRAKHLGPILFSLGMVFSILLTLGAGLLFIILFFGVSILKSF